MNIFFDEMTAYIIIAALAIWGIIINLLKNTAYNVYVKASCEAATTNNRYVKGFVKGAMEKKRENTDNYVDRCIYYMKFLKIRLHTWDRLSSVNLVALVMMSAIICVDAYYNKKSDEIIVALVLYSLVSAMILCIVSIALSSYDKMRFIRFNMADYLDSCVDKIVSQNEKTLRKDNSVAEVKNEVRKPAEKIVYSNASTPQQETPQQEALKQETLKKEALKQEALKQETLRQETPQQETLKQEASRQETWQQETSQLNTSQPGKKFSDAVYQAAIEKMALEYTKNNASGKDQDKSGPYKLKEDKNESDEAGSRLIESIIREMLQ